MSYMVYSMEAYFNDNSAIVIKEGFIGYFGLVKRVNKIDPFVFRVIARTRQQFTDSWLWFLRSKHLVLWRNVKQR